MFSFQGACVHILPTYVQTTGPIMQIFLNERYAAGLQPRFVGAICMHATSCTYNGSQRVNAIMDRPLKKVHSMCVTQQGMASQQLHGQAACIVLQHVAVACIAIRTQLAFGADPTGWARPGTEGALIDRNGTEDSQPRPSVITACVLCIGRKEGGGEEPVLHSMHY